MIQKPFENVPLPSFERITAVNEDTSAIPAGEVVCVIGFSGRKPSVTTFSNGGIIVGVTIQEIPAEDEGIVMRNGITGIDGSSFTEGELLYASESGITNSPGTTLSQLIGYYIGDDKMFVSIQNPSARQPVWGEITGTLSDQTDLQAEIDSINGHIDDLDAAVNTKVTANAPIVGATKTKVTYDTKGLVTAGADATTADVSDSLNRRYVSDAQLTVIQNTSGTNTGDNATNTTSNSYADGKVSDTAYGSGWNGVTSIAPSKNAVYDRLESGLVGTTVAYVEKTSTYTISATTDFIVNCTSGTFTVDLPTAVGITGRMFIIKNTGGGTITVNGDGSETIDGSLTQLLTTTDSLHICSTGVNWIIL